MDYEIEKQKIIAPSPSVEPSPSVSPEPTEAPKQPIKMNGFYQPSAESRITLTSQQNDAAKQTREKSAAAHKRAVAETAEFKAKSLVLKPSDESDLVMEAPSESPAETHNFLDKSLLKDSKAKLSKSPAYTHILAKNNKTIYEKTSEILDDYMKNHTDEYPEYAKLNDSQKKAFRDAEMGKMLRKLAGKQNLTKADRKTATRDLAILLSTAETKGLSLKELSSDPKEMKAQVDQGDKELYNSMLSKIDTSDPDKALDDIAELYLTFTDPDYLLLEGAKKTNYMKSQQRKIFAMFGVADPKKDINSDAKSNAVNIMKGLLSGLTEKDMTIKDLVNLPASDQSKLLVESLEKYEKEHPEITSKLSPESKQAFEILKVRSSLIKETGKKNPTERDLFNLLLEKEKAGNISEQEKLILDSYKMVDLAGKRRGKDFLATTANMSSNVAKRMVNGLTYKAQFKSQLDGVDDPKEIVKIVNEIAQGINTDTDKVAQLEALRQVMMEKGYKPKEIIAMLPDDMAQAITARALAHSNHEQAARATDLLASFNSETVDETANDMSFVMSEARSAEWLQNYGANVETTKYDEAFTAGVNQNLDIDTANQVFTYIANNATTDEKKASIVEYSLTTTTDSERISVYTDSYKTIQSPAVTEGMAAAAYNTSDPANKAIINSGVDYAVENNGYSSSELESINTARQTGNTSYSSSTGSSSSTSSATSKSSSKTTSASQNSDSGNSSNRVSSTGSSSSNNNANKVKLSPQNKSAAAEIRDTLLKLQYESSVAQKEKAMADLERIINKIQNDSEVRAQKQAELKAKEAKSEEEVAQAITEADNKSVQQQQEDQVKLVTEVVEDVIDNSKLDKKYDIPLDTINKLRNAAKQGDLVTIYNELGNISSDAQRRFVQFISRKDTATIIGFIRNRSTDKALIRQLCKLNPSLIKSLDSDLLISCGLAKSDIIKYAGSAQLAIMFRELSKVGNTDQLRQFYEALGYDAQQYTALNNAILPGDDRYYAMLRNNMSNASASSNVVGNSRFTDGQTRQKIRPQDIDYNDYLA